MNRTMIVLYLLLLPAVLFAQGPPPPLPPEVGNAVLLATRSIQVDRDCVVTSGDLVVNNASAGPWLGERELSLDQGVRTPPGYALKANSIDLDSGVVIGGEVRYNSLQNDGTVNGALITPLALPVIGMLPALPDRPAGTEAITVADGTVRPLGLGAYGDVLVGRGATLRLPGGPYSFLSLTVERGGSIVWDGPGDVVIRGRMNVASEVTIVNRPDITTKRKMFFVHAPDAEDGTPSVSIGRDSVVAATIHAPNGSVLAGESLRLTGSIVARDIRVGRGSTLTVRSGFRNLPPVAINQNVTVGSSPVTITLSGFDPDSDPLIFSIGLQPAAGNLGPVTPSGPTSAVVVYTPRSESPNDVFTFRVTDSESFFAMGVVTINEGTLPAPPTTVIAQDSNREVPAGPPTILTLLAVGPPGVPLTFSIVPNSGPFHGELTNLTQPSFMPPRPAQVVYRPAQGFTGEDVFRFQACGTIGGVLVCDEGRFVLAVEGPEPPSELAPDIAVPATSNTPTPITLGAPPPPTGGGGGGGEGGGEGGPRLTTSLKAAFNSGAAVAGNVADVNGDGHGDDHNPLPGPAPLLMSAGVGQSGGGPGSNGTTRMHFEWNISGFAGLASQLDSATVVLRTNRGATDSLTTRFFWIGAESDGQLADSDFQREGEIIEQAVMPVPANQPVGADGVFSFNVLPQIREALLLGFTHFTIQGRVDESSLVPANGLQVYTTASGNATANRVPQLGLTTPNAGPSRVFRVLTLPANGRLTDSNGVVITAVPYTLPSPILTYQSNVGFSGTDTFQYSSTEGQLSDTGTVTITVTGGGDGRD